jgi:hypothetical protein
MIAVELRKVKDVDATLCLALVAGILRSGSAPVAELASSLTSMFSLAGFWELPAPPN